MVDSFKYNRKLEHIFLYVCLTIIFLSSLLISYWLLIPDNVVTVSNPDKIAVEKSVYQKGEHITYTISYCKTRKIVGRVSRALVNSIRTVYITVYSDLPIGCHTTKISELTIPEFLDSGIYHLEGTAEYKVNPLKTLNVYWRSVDFKIQ